MDLDTKEMGFKHVVSSKINSVNTRWKGKVTKIAIAIGILFWGLYVLNWIIMRDIRFGPNELPAQPDYLWEANIINSPGPIPRSMFLSLCLLKKLQFLLISGHEFTKVQSLYRYNLETTKHVAIFENDTAKVEDVLSVMGSRIPTTIIYSNSSNYSEIVKQPWALRGEVPIGLNVVAYSLFNGSFLISIVKEVGNETEEFIYPYYIVPYSDSRTARAFRSLSFVRVESDQYPGLFLRPQNESHFQWELEISEFKQCNYSRLTEVVKKYGAQLVENDTGVISSYMKSMIGLFELMENWEKRIWLFSGSLLGWYRQCSIIGFDRDADTSMSISDFEPWMIPYFLKHPFLRIFWKLGRQNDSLEFKFYGQGFSRENTVDLFWMYTEKTYNWVGIQTFMDTRLKRISHYPLVFDKLCSGDLHGFLIRVPCDTRAVIHHEYGESEWRTPNPQYNFHQDSKNSRDNGTWTAAEWGKDGNGEVYSAYNPNGKQRQ